MYATALAEDMFAFQQIQAAEQQLGVNLQRTNIAPADLPKTMEDLELHLQLSYKQSIEIAEEEAIEQTLAKNKWELTKRRLNEDLVVCGIACAKTNFNVANGITLDLSLIHI